MRDELLRQATRIVIKVGSSLVASRDTGLRPEQIDRLADEIAALRSSGREVLIVSSGAIVSGIYYWQTVSQIPPVAQFPVHKDEMAGWKTYTNTEYGFEFKIPKDWEELKGSGDLVNNRWISFGIFNLRTDSESAYPVRGDISFQAQGWNIQEDTLVSTGKTEQLDFNQWFEKFHKVKEYAEHDFAINNVVNAVAEEKNRILLTMATGTGKTADTVYPGRFCAAAVAI